MRIRFTLDIQRTPRPTPQENPQDGSEPPVIYDVSGAQVEHAGFQPMGFTAPNRDDY